MNKDERIQVLISHLQMPTQLKQACIEADSFCRLKPQIVQKVCDDYIKLVNYYIKFELAREKDE